MDHNNSNTNIEDGIIVREGSPHLFTQTSFSSLTFCNLCREFMWGLSNSGVECIVCGFVAHNCCIETMAPPVTCRITSLPALCGLSRLEEENQLIERLALDNFEEIYEMHHWVEGNCHVAKSCFLCNEVITSVGKYSYRCSLCKCQAHKCCLQQASNTICHPKHESLLIRKRSFYKETSTPLIVFINSRSGGNQGEYLIRKFQRLLNPNQVIDLNQQRPEVALAVFQHHPNLRILCCGGDGTVGWVLSALDQFPKISPEVCVLPLGTGNDLARTFNWGGGYAEEKVSPILDRIIRSTVVPLDRWAISIQPYDSSAMKTPKQVVMNNYFSIGVDASVALAFHNLRNEAPALCASRVVNKFWYVVNGMKTMLGKIPLIDQSIQVEVDGKNCWIDENIGAIICLNLPSYMGGADLWGRSKDGDEFRKPSVNDRILELVAVTGSFHLANVSINLASAIRLAQGSRIKFKFTSNQSLPVQVDGEPWLQAPCEITIDHLNQVQMLKAPDEPFVAEEEIQFLDFEGTLF